MKVPPALIGRAGELITAAELLRRGIDIAQPSVDIGVDLLAYSLTKGNAAPTNMVPIQVKSYSSTGYKFMKSWFDVSPGLVLVSVWHVATTPQCHVFGSIADVEDALGQHANSPSWTVNGVYSVTSPGPDAVERVGRHCDKWQRIIDRVTASLAPSDA